MRLLIIAGEKLPAVDPSGLSYTIANGYGPTENCYGVSLFPIHEWEQNIPIGKPFRTIHGFRIETKEIESVIRNFGGVKDATVQAHQNWP